VSSASTLAPARSSGAAIRLRSQSASGSSQAGSTTSTQAPWKPKVVRRGATIRFSAKDRGTPAGRLRFRCAIDARLLHASCRTCKPFADRARGARRGARRVWRKSPSALERGTSRGREEEELARAWAGSRWPNSGCAPFAGIRCRDNPDRGSRRYWKRRSRQPVPSIREGLGTSVAAIELERPRSVARSNIPNRASSMSSYPRLKFRAC